MPNMRAVAIAGVGLLILAIIIFWVKVTTDWTEKDPSQYKEDEGGIACIQVITPARNLETGEIRDFPTPCDVPEGWETQR